MCVFGLMDLYFCMYVYSILMKPCIIHPSSMPLIHYGSRGSWSQSQRTLGERWGTDWQVANLIGILHCPKVPLMIQDQQCSQKSKPTLRKHQHCRRQPSQTIQEYCSVWLKGPDYTLLNPTLHCLSHFGSLPQINPLSHAS